MCTVSIITLPGGGFRLVTNRDESPDRPRAAPPTWRGPVRGPARGIWPVDGLAGGTWVAAAEHGLALTILNAYDPGGPPGPEPDQRQSRGILIPRLIGQADAGSAIGALREFDLPRLDPFRLVAVDSALEIHVGAWDGRSLRLERQRLPACFASSGLGDRLVRCRVPLFGEMVAEPGATRAAQDAFHAHRWPDRPELSVMMERDGARTVSVTSVEVSPAGPGRFSVSMEHQPIGAEAAR